MVPILYSESAESHRAVFVSNCLRLCSKQPDVASPQLRFHRRLTSAASHHAGLAWLPPSPPWRGEPPLPARTSKPATPSRRGHHRRGLEHCCRPPETPTPNSKTVEPPFPPVSAVADIKSLSQSRTAAVFNSSDCAFTTASTRRFRIDFNPADHFNDHHGSPPLLNSSCCHKSPLQLRPHLQLDEPPWRVEPPAAAPGQRVAITAFDPLI